MFPAISAAVLQCCSVSAVRAGNYRIITAVSNSVSRSSHFPTTTTTTTGDRGVLHGTEHCYPILTSMYMDNCLLVLSPI